MAQQTVYLQSTASTNNVARELAEQGSPNGTAVVAVSQSQGRGRLGRSWSSPLGTGLYCSIVLRPSLPADHFPHLSLVAGLAVAQVIERFCGLPVGLKWPNDIFLDGKKCGGILAESSPLTRGDQQSFVVVGIGLNVNTRREDFPKEIQHEATSLLMQSKKRFEINELFVEIHRNLLKEVERFEQQGVGQLIDRWRGYDILCNKVLQWVSVAGEVVSGISMGLDNQGRLHIRDDKGRIHEILSGDIRLANTA